MMTVFQENFIDGRQVRAIINRISIQTCKFQLVERNWHMGFNLISKIQISYFY